MSEKYSVSVGQVFGKLTVVEKVSGRYPYLVRCECGSEVKKDAVSLHRMKNKMCLACSREAVPMSSRSLKAPGTSAGTQLYLRTKDSASKRGIEFHISREDFFVLTKQTCFYCGSEPASVFRKANILSGDYVYNGLDRVDSQGHYTMDNVVPACQRCNQGKNDMTVQEFYEWIGRVYRGTRA